MFSIYADGKLLNVPPEEVLTVLSPKLTLEMGKAGSLEFSLAPNHLYYDALRKLKTSVAVYLDEDELFCGRVLSHSRNLRNVKRVYAEGDLAYLVDSVQKPEKFAGTTHALFERIVDAHNAQLEPEKQFAVGIINIEDREIIISGLSDDIADAETGDFDYKQIAINAASGDWPTTYDYIESTLITYCGGYLRTRRVDGTTYLDLVTDYGNHATQEIAFGTNLLDLTEETADEEAFTVLIPLGDDGLTIASVNQGNPALEDAQGIEQYGRIVKTHVFDNVTEAATLLENAQRFLANRENVPITFTIQAVDLHLIDPDIQEIHVGDLVRVRSAPHRITEQLTCTRIEYDLENPANNTYTFGNPKQTLTQRYRKDKQKTDNASSGGGGSGTAGQAADDKAKDSLKTFFEEWIRVDPDNPDGHVSLGTAYKELKDAKEVIKREAGIDFDVTPESGRPNASIYALRKDVDDVDGRTINNSAQIAIVANELKSEIDARAAWGEGLNSSYSELLLRVDKDGKAIADLRASHGQSLANLELRANNLEASAVLKADYDANRGEDSQRFAAIELTASEQGTTILAQADTIKSKASTYTLDTKVAEINAEIADINAETLNIKADIVNINAEITNVRTLIADEIDAVKADIGWLEAKTMTVNGLVAGTVVATQSVRAPSIYKNGYMVATEIYVQNMLGSYATQDYVDSRNAWGSSMGNYKLCTIGGSTVGVSTNGHTHSDYCTEARVLELIAAAIIPWANVSDKPSEYNPTSHRHSFSVNKTMAFEHRHDVTVNGLSYTSDKQATNKDVVISYSSNTGYAGGS